MFFGNSVRLQLIIAKHSFLNHRILNTRIYLCYVICKVILDSTAYSHIFRTFSIPGIFRTLTYSKARRYLDLCQTYCSAFRKQFQAIIIFAGRSFISDAWQDSKCLCASISANQLAQLFQFLLQACSGIFKHYSRAYPCIFKILCIPWHIQILGIFLSKSIFRLFCGNV